MELLVFFCILLALVMAKFGGRSNHLPAQLFQRAHELTQEGDDRGAMRCIARLRLDGHESWCAAAGFIRMSILADRGDSRSAVHVARRVLRFLSEGFDACPWDSLNLVVVTFINGGRHEEALSASQSWTNNQRDRGREEEPDGYLLVRINEAEALGNLARFAEALALLDEVQDASGISSFALAGLVTLRAWILLQAGRVDEAKELLADADLTPICPLYEAEVEYTYAALARDTGDLDAAMRHARQGFAAARRAASRRNGIFMVASIAALRGETEKARRLFERGAKARYQAQAGEGLTRYARLLDALGETEGAKRVRGWIVERDPEWRDPRTAREGEERGGSQSRPA